MSLDASPTRDRPKRLDVDGGLRALQSNSEFRSPVETLDGYHSNNHLALLYESKREQLESVVPFVRQGLERGERCMCVVGELSTEEIIAALREANVDVDAARESGQLTFHTVEETYLRGGTFDPEEMVEFYADAIEEAVREYGTLRVTAEAIWIQDARTTLEDLMTYESRVNDLFDDDLIALCQYDRNAFEPETVRGIIRTHPYLIYEGTVCHNIYYTPPREFFEPDRPACEVDRMMETLLDRAEASARLEEREYYLQRAYEITSNPDLSFEEKLEALLTLGCERFGLEQGYLNYLPIEGEDFEIVEGVTSSSENVRKGTPSAQPGPGTFCRRTVAESGPVAVPDVHQLGWDDDPIYEEYGISCYFAVRITVNTDTYGTLAFCDTSPRDEEFTDAEYTFLELMGQWISYELEREHKKAQLAALNEMSRDLMSAETRSEIAETTIEHAHETLELPVTSLVTYDRQSGTLSPAAQTPRAEDELPTARLCDRESGVLWEAFVADEIRVLDDVAAISGAGDDISDVIAVPLEQQGLLIAATTAPDGISNAERDFVEAAAATVKTAYTRAAREQQLQQREGTLKEQNETLERLNRINDIIRSIDQALVQASTRQDVQRAVCEQLADTGPYELAWIGKHDAITDRVTRQEWAGAEKGYFEEITAHFNDNPKGSGPVSRATETYEPQIVNDILDDASFKPWRKAALNRGYHACAALPLVYEETLYGVLMVYAGQPGVFDELERAVLAEMADTIAYSINAVESKKAIVSNEVTRLEFAMDDTDLPVVELIDEFDCEIALESLVPRTDGELRGFFSTRGVRSRDVLAFADRLAVTEISLISEHDEGSEPFGLFEVVLDDNSLCKTVVEHGGRPCELAGENGTATATVELAADAAIREFVDMFQATFPNSELVAQRSLERPQQTPTEFFAKLIESLTVRQLETLQMAHFSGYFQEPRLQNATDIADTMDISQPTFNSHLRAAQRKICQQLFDEQSLQM